MTGHRVTGPTRPTVGRRTESDQIVALVDRLVAGSGGVLTLRGEAGVGKSHLATVATERAEAAGVLVARGGADELERDRPGRVLSAVLGALSGSDGRRPSASADPDAADPAHGGDPAYRVIESFVAIVERSSAARPLLLVTEDLHWADELSLRGLAALVRRIDQLACMLLITTRTQPRPERLGVLEAMAEQAGGQTVELGGLEPAAVEELASAMLGARPGTNLRTVLAGAAGNPFMIEEVLQAAANEQLVDVDDGVADVAQAAVPARLHEVLMHNLRALPDETFAILRHAALLGTRFTATEIAALTGGAVVDVVGALGPAVEAGTIEADDGREHRFRHDLVREVIYRSIPAAARWDLHRAAGTALAHLGAPAPRVAQQFSAGARPGDVDAVHWLLRAADEALVFDTSAAADLLQRALTLAPADWPERSDREADLVEILAWAGRVEAATTRGQALVDRAVDGHSRFRAHQAMGTARSSAGDLASAAEEFNAAASEGVADPVIEAQIRCAAAGMAVIAGSLPVEDAERETLPHAGSTVPEIACTARNTLAITALCRGAYGEAFDHARMASAILDDTYVRPLGFLIPHSWTVASLMYLDRDEAARTAAEAARARAERRGDAGLLLQIMAATCGMTWGRAEWDDTLAEIEAAFDLAEETGVVAQTILLHSLAAQIARERGRPDDAAEHLAAADVFLSSGTHHLFGLEVLALEHARALRDREDDDGACELLLGVWEATAAVRGLIQWRLVGPEVVDVCMATGRHQDAATVAADLVEVARHSTAPSASATARRAAGIANRDADELVGAADAMLATPRRIEAAATCENAAKMLLDHDPRRSDDVARLLDAAQAIYTLAGAAVSTERVHELRRQADLPAHAAPERPTFGWDALTPKEREVVALVSEGMSNPEIAGTMFISRRTVEAHLTHIFRKLDVANRTQLARQAIDRGLG